MYRTAEESAKTINIRHSITLAATAETEKTFAKRAFIATTMVILIAWFVTG